MVASDRISTYDVVHPTPIPDKGKVLTGLSVLWFGLTTDIVPTTSSPPPTACPTEFRGRALRVRKLRDAARRVRRARLHHRLGLEGLPGAPARSRASSCPRACRSPSSSRSRSTRRRRRPRRATTRRSTSSETVELVGDARARRAAARRRRSRSTARVADARARARRDPRRHEVRVRPRRGRRAVARRRGLHAGLLALLAGRRATSRAAASRRSTSSTCATGRRARGWDKNPPAPAIPDDVVAQHARALRDGLRAARGRAVRRVAGPDGAREGAAC